MKYAIYLLSLFVVSVTFSDCSKPADSATQGPVDAVKARLKSLEDQDSAAFVLSLSQDKRDVYSTNPGKVDSILKHWKGNHGDITVLSVKQSDSTAIVLYNLNVTGANPHKRDSVYANLVLEKGVWKNGY